MWNHMSLITLLLVNGALYAATVLLAWQAWKKMGVLTPLFWVFSSGFSQFVTLILLWAINRYLGQEKQDALIDQLIATIAGWKGQSLATIASRYAWVGGSGSILKSALLLLMVWEDLRLFGKEPRETNSRVAIALVTVIVLLGSGFSVSLSGFKVWPNISYGSPPSSVAPPITPTPLTTEPKQ